MELFFLKFRHVLILKVMCLWCLGSSVLQAQERTWQHAYTYPEKVSNFTKDDLNHLYIINQKGELLKYLPTGELIFRYSNRQLGAPAEIDATDPFNILLFYRSFQKIVLLDRTLNETAQIDLLAAGFGNITAVGMSRNNQIWLYDELDFKLKKIDRAGKTVFASDNLSMLLPVVPAPTQIMERDFNVYLNDPDCCMYLFNNFGAYQKKLLHQPVAYFQIQNNQLIYPAGIASELTVYDLRSLLAQPLSLPSRSDNPALKILLGKEALYILHRDRTVQRYRFL